MTNRRFLRCFAFAAISLGAAAQAEDATRPAEYQEHIDGWTILGDFQAGACIAMMQSASNTSLSIAAMPNRSTLIFSIQNEQWRSLKNDEDLRVTAVFRTKGRITDGWSLDSVGVNVNDAKPGFRFDIDGAKNDNASFPDQFSKSESLEFLRDRIPVARFSLKGSREALAHLYDCRSQLRANPNFDPFEK